MGKLLSLAALAALFAAPVLAEPPERFKEGEQVSISGEFVCVTDSQIRLIMEGFAVDSAVGVATYIALQQIPSPYGGPACAVARSNTVTLVANAGHVENVNLPGGEVGTVYIIEIEYLSRAGRVSGFASSFWPLPKRGVAL